MKPLDVLFLCETNAATSLMAEALVNHAGDMRLRAFSAGRVPAPAMLNEARETLRARGIATDSLEPKAWSIFGFPGARRPNLIVDLATVSWTQPELRDIADGAILRWPLQDPAVIDGRSRRRAVAEMVLGELAKRIDRHFGGGLGLLVGLKTGPHAAPA